jgi:hypothetical protein
MSSQYQTTSSSAKIAASARSSAYTAWHLHRDAGRRKQADLGVRARVRAGSGIYMDVPPSWPRHECCAGLQAAALQSRFDESTDGKIRCHQTTCLRGSLSNPDNVTYVAKKRVNVTYRPGRNLPLFVFLCLSYYTLVLIDLVRQIY